MRVRDSSRASRVKGSLRLRSGLALGSALLLAVVLTHQLCQLRSDNRIDTRGRTLTDFIQLLQSSGLQLQVVPTAQHGTVSEGGEGVYLTTDADATWESMARKRRAAEYIHEWHGTVWLGRAHSHHDAEGELALWGECGCRVGDFLLFGDKRLLDRIREVCR